MSATFVFAATLATIIAMVVDSAAQSVSIALWKDGARGAYSMLGDDYGCQYYGNLAIIDSTTENRGIRMGFTTVSDFPACLGSCSQRYWDFANNVLVPKGHELVTHSFDHTWHLKTREALALIVDTSQAHIEAHVPANECLFFGDYGGMYTDSFVKIGPFYYPLEPQPATKDSMVNYMKHQKFIGARMGGISLAQCNGVNPGSYDPFLTAYTIWTGGGTQGIDQLKSLVQCAIDNGGHLNYEFHNIGELVSWSPIGYEDWVTVLNYLKGKMDAGDLWVETVQRITKYMMERNIYTVSISAEDASSMQIRFNTSMEINPSPLIDNGVYDEDLTLVITTRHGHSVRVNAGPFDGPVTVQYGAGGILSVMQNGVTLTGTPVAVAPAAATVRASRPYGISLIREPSAIVVHNSTGRAIPVRVYALSGRCVFEATASGRNTTIGTHGFAAGSYTAVAGNSLISFAVLP